MKSMNLIVMVSILAGLTLTGCQSVPRADRNITLDRLNGKALVVASVTNNDAKYLGGANQFPPMLKVRNIATGQELEFHGGDTPRVPNPGGGGWDIGAVISKELTPGTYEIYDFETPRVMYHVHVVAVDKPRIRFEVLPNTATYIGNVNFYAAGSTYSLTVHDQRRRDLGIFSEYWPRVDPERIETRLATDARK